MIRSLDGGRWRCGGVAGHASTAVGLDVDEGEWASGRSLLRGGQGHLIELQWVSLFHETQHCAKGVDCASVYHSYRANCRRSAYVWLRRRVVRCYGDRGSEWLAGDRQIVSYIQNCGATTDYTANVSLYSPGDSIGKPGSVFFADHANGVKLERVSPDTVKVTFAATRVIRAKEEVGGIVFLYEEDWRAF